MYFFNLCFFAVFIRPVSLEALQGGSPGGSQGGSLGPKIWKLVSKYRVLVLPDGVNPVTIRSLVLSQYEIPAYDGRKDR